MTEKQRELKIAACQVEPRDQGWDVNSPSGHTYHVRLITKIGKYDGSMYFNWDCDCPARGVCVHIEAVERYRMAQELGAAEHGDYDGLDLMERIE